MQPNRVSKVQLPAKPIYSTYTMHIQLRNRWLSSVIHLFKTIGFNMNNLQVSEDHVITSQFNTPQIFDLPNDLVIYILSRLPVKSLAKCRCVSKLWSTIFCRPRFSELFPIKSSGLPKLLFDEVIFFSSPQPQDPYENSSKLLTDYRNHSFINYKKIDVDFNQTIHGMFHVTLIVKPKCFLLKHLSSPVSIPIFRPVNGLICRQDSSRTKSVDLNQ